jgi:phosphoglucomutase
MVVFGTSGHRGSSLDGAFNDAHIAATTQASMAVVHAGMDKAWVSLPMKSGPSIP